MATYISVRDLILEKLAPGQNITALKHQDVEKALLDFAEAQWLVGDIKEVDCTNQYITDNFETNGKGKNERLGWAICNGNNGTRNRTGRVSVAYGNVTPLDSTNASQFTAMGTTGSPIVGGSKTHTLSILEMPAHTHTEIGPDGDSSHAGGSSGYNRPNGKQTNDTSSAGGGVAHNNMQPYIVTLFIQKIPIV